MNRIEENEELRSGILEHKENLSSEAITASMLMDISKSMAVIADKLNPADVSSRRVPIKLERIIRTSDGKKIQHFVCGRCSRPVDPDTSFCPFCGIGLDTNNIIMT